MDAVDAVPPGRTLVLSPTSDLGAEVRQSALLLGLVLAVAGGVTAICSLLQLLG